MEDATARIALITGANKGIGFEIARQTGKTGARVLLGARSAALGEAAAAALNAEGLDVRFIRLDVAKPEAIEAAARVVEAEHGQLDVLVNNRGIVDRTDAPPSRTSIEAVRRVFDANLFGALAVMQAMLRC